ncbi:nicotinamidase-related amidase [Pantoea alhagi]|uniref:cysteine hydrolase family protein n=1 Tax=Mixta sp. BE291 TaxID=3158787 RepID=UPI0028626354|nr:nicotinamidase-related amidase [Pantoea alhagi]
MTRKAIIVIDLQNEYLPTGKLPLTGIEAAAANAVKVIANARANGVPVFHIQHIFANNEMPVFVPDSDGIKIQSTVLPAGNEPVIVKNYVNSFLKTNLRQLLEEQGIEDLVVVGAMSHMCVDAAVRAASDFGYGVTVLHDACATLDLEFNGVKVPAEQVHATMMAALAFAYAKVQSTSDYLAA